MNIADLTSELSYATRLKVGCVIIKDNQILSTGYNGTAPGNDNCCEYVNNNGDTVTKPEVIHAEINAISKVAASTMSTEDAIMFITHLPCIECAKAILQSKIKTVIYKNIYRDLKGFDLLKNNNVYIESLEEILK